MANVREIFIKDGLEGSYMETLGGRVRPSVDDEWNSRVVIIEGVWEDGVVEKRPWVESQ